MIQEAYEYVSSSLWYCLMFIGAENQQHIEIKWVGTGKEQVAMGTVFFKSQVCFLYNYWIALLIYFVYDVISHLICMF